jgi:hypothetical protein
MGKWSSIVASEFGGYIEESQSCYNMDSSQPRAPSFARRTLLGLTGRQNKAVHSSYLLPPPFNFSLFFTFELYSF